MPSLEELDPSLVGQRLLDARKAVGLNQSVVAEKLGVSRPTYVNIEQGKRLPRHDEIKELAKLFRRKVSELLRPDEPTLQLVPHLRSSIDIEDTELERELTGSLIKLDTYAKNYHRLESLLNAPLRQNYPREVKLPRSGDIASLAESVANEERQRLGLGDRPIIHLRTLLELEVGLRIFYASMPSKVAGMFAFDSEMGGCILINRRHPRQKRRASMVHEYGHLIVDRHKAGVDYIGLKGQRKPVNERFAEPFGLCFLMPRTSVGRRFHEVRESTNDFQVADLCRLAHTFDVSVEAMTLRLEDLGHIRKGTWTSLKKAGIAPRKMQDSLRLLSRPDDSRPYSDRYLSLVVTAYERGDLSEGELQRYLDCDTRAEARRLADEVLTAISLNDDGETEQLQFDFTKEESLLP